MIGTKFCAKKWLIVKLRSSSSSACLLVVSVQKKFLFLIIKRLMVYVLIRLENEHLNNVGKYRAFNSVPLPFDYDNDEMRTHL